jgi:hypothetical protein
VSEQSDNEPTLDVIEFWYLKGHGVWHSVPSYVIIVIDSGSTVFPGRCLYRRGGDAYIKNPNYPNL